MREEEVRKPLNSQESGEIMGNTPAPTYESIPELKSTSAFEAVSGSNPALELSPASSISEAGVGRNIRQTSGSKPGSKAKLVAFSLMLAVPAVLSGCGSSDECDPEYDTGCEYDSSSGHYYYGGYGGSSYRSSKDGSSSYKSSSKSKSSGFGSFFRSSGG